jgi:hypothetical protein
MASRLSEPEVEENRIAALFIVAERQAFSVTLLTCEHVAALFVCFGDKMLKCRIPEMSAACGNAAELSMVAGSRKKLNQ